MSLMNYKGGEQNYETASRLWHNTARNGFITLAAAATTSYFTWNNLPTSGAPVNIFYWLQLAGAVPAGLGAIMIQVFFKALKNTFAPVSYSNSSSVKPVDSNPTETTPTPVTPPPPTDTPTEPKPKPWNDWFKKNTGLTTDGDDTTYTDASGTTYGELTDW
jgi:hypothetical protein